MSLLFTIKSKVREELIPVFSKLGRWEISASSLSGEGIEIGAMDLPLKIKRGMSVRYLDRIPKEDSAKIFPSIASKLVNVDLIGDGETLDIIESGSQDFVIGNHFIEHTENPVFTIENMLRVLRPGGKIFMAIPDKRYTFDEFRAITPFDHLVKDYTDGPAWSQDEHYYDFVKHTEHGTGKTDKEIIEVISKLKAMNWSIHFHVWDHQAMIDMFSMLKRHFGFQFEIEVAVAARPSGNESIFVLRKY